MMAPEPQDLLWDCASMTFDHRYVRGLVVSLLTALLILFWQIPVALAQAFASLRGLAEKVSFMEDVVDALPENVLGIIEGFLPTLIIIIFFILVPIILVALAKAEGAVSLSAAHWSAGNRLFLFQIFNVFIGNLIAGAIFNQIDQVIRKEIKGRRKQEEERGGRRRKKERKTKGKW